MGVLTVDQLPLDQIAEICRRYHVQELSVFGSVARGEAGPDSDVDLLVVFDPAAQIGLIEFSQLQRELQAAVKRKVDVGTKRAIKPRLRESILRDARVLYAA